MDIRSHIIDSSIEIFTKMVMMEITVKSCQFTERGKLENTITGVIGLAGTYKGVLAIHVPNPVAYAITGNFLGIEVNEINEDVEDAIGEVANMLGGNIKSILSQKGRDIDLSLPSTIAGTEYIFQTIKGAARNIIHFDTSHGSFMVELQLEKNSPVT